MNKIILFVKICALFVALLAIVSVLVIEDFFNGIKTVLTIK
jgi:hypothetical protein